MVNNYLISLHGDRWATRIIMVTIQYVQNYQITALYQELTQFVGQLYFKNKLIEKEIQTCGYKRWEAGEGTGEGGQKMQTSSYK